MNRDSAFSYECHGCGRCCYHKRIQTNPYEVLRLARNRGLSTAVFVQRYLEADGPYLRVGDDGACVFLSARGCEVHPDRPLACRTYPLGRWVDADGTESFRELDPHPHTEGIYGRSGTVQEYLVQQGEPEYSAAADSVQQAFYRLFDELQEVLSCDPSVAGDAQMNLSEQQPGQGSPFLMWLDVDGMVEEYCAARNIPLPESTEDILNLHLSAVDQGLRKLTGETK